MRTILTAGLILAAAAGMAAADHTAGKPYANGAAKSGDVAYRAVEQGTLHPGHVAVFSSDKYNKPAADYHLDGTPYEAGPGGYGKQQSENAPNN